MPNTPTQDSPDRDADRKSQTMHEQLRKDVESWSAARSHNTAHAAEEFRVPVTQPPARRAPTKAKAATPATPEAKPATTAKKPFSMSYDGVTTAQHIAYRASRGAR